MNLFKRGKNCKQNDKIIFVITEKLKPWIVINCLEKENYIITEKQAETLAKVIINQAINLNVLEDLLKKIKFI